MAWNRINIDLEANNFLNNMLDYTTMPYKLKDTSSLWCISVRDEDTEQSVLLLPKEVLNEKAPTTVTEYSSYTDELEGFITDTGETVYKPTGNKIRKIFASKFYYEDGSIHSEFLEEGVTEDSLSTLTSETKSIPEGVAYNLIPKREMTYDMLKKICENAEEISGHNIISYDLPVLKLFGIIDYTIAYPTLDGEDEKVSTLYGRPVKFSDTLIKSKMVNPDLQDSFGRHSIEAHGQRLGFPKVQFNEFHKWSWYMGYYGDNDTLVGSKLNKHLKSEMEGWDWDLAYSMELKLMDLTVYQEHFGFYLDKDLAEWCLVDLENKLQERADTVEPSLPPKPLNKGETAFYTPPARQILKNGKPNSFITKFAEKHGAEIVEKPRRDDEGAIDYFFVYKDKEWQIPFEEPLETSLKTNIKDNDQVKSYLLNLGWDPTEWSERDVTKDSKKVTLTSEKVFATVQRYCKDTENSVYKTYRLEHFKVKTTEALSKKLLKEYDKNPNKPLRVITSPKLRVGATKDLCPNLKRIAKDPEFVKAIAEWHTYTHRKNSISGGGLDDEGNPQKGFLSFLREDGRVPTPADTLGAASARYTHKQICNISRVSSLYGNFMRALFGCGEGYYQFGFDFASLEAVLQAHYIFNYIGGRELGVSLLAEKPNDVHCYSEDTEILTTEGWKTFGNISKNTLVAQYQDGTISFVNPLDIVWQDYKGSMISIENKRTSMLVTPNHRVLTNNRKQIVREAREFLKLSSQFNFPVSGYCSGVDIYSKEFYELVIAIQADAHLNTDCNAITFSFTKDRKITRLKSLLKSLGILYSNHTSFREGREETVIRLLAKDETTTLLRSFFNIDKSLVGNPFISLSLNTKRHIINSLGVWDGTVRANGDIVLDTTDFEFVDKLQAVAVTSGYKAMVNSYVKTTSFGVTTIKRLYLSKSTLNSSFKDSAKTLEYNGKIGCVSVPSGFVVVRRNDRVFISGNTLNAKKLGISRDNAKSITYALLYGAAATKLQKMLGLSKEEAEAMYEAYWDAVPPLKALRDDLVAYWEGVDRDHIKAIDGRKLRARSPHSLINLLFQSAGAIMAKWSVVRIAEKLEQQNLLGNPFEDTKDAVKVFQMIVYHDEVQYALHKSLLPQITSFFRQDIQDQYLADMETWKANGEDKKTEPSNPFEVAAAEFIKQQTTDDPLMQFSDIGHTDEGAYYVTHPNVVSQTIIKAIQDVVLFHDLEVPLGISWITGLNWKMCH